jgi:hypothetical protein
LDHPGVARSLFYHAQELANGAFLVHEYLSHVTHHYPLSKFDRKAFNLTSNFVALDTEIEEGTSHG